MMMLLWPVLIQIALILTSPTYAEAPNEGDTTLYTTVTNDEMASITTVEEQTEKDESEDYYERAALQSLPKDAKVIFLADDLEAASRIPELLTTLNETRVLLDASLFPSQKFGTAFHKMQIPKNLERELEYETNSNDTHEEKLHELIVPKSKEDRIGNSRYNLRPLKDHRRPYVPSPGTSFSSHHGAVDNFVGPPKPTLIDYRPRPPRPYGQSSFKRTLYNMTRVSHIEAECQDDFMRIHVRLNGSFEGLIYSSGYAYDMDCIYINGTGRSLYDFYIQLNRCGTLNGNEKGADSVRGRTSSKNIMWNTLTVQYNPLIEEEWDEHFKVTCEYGYDFWKTVSFPFLDVEVQTGNPVLFTLTPPECHMEIRHGFGPSGKRVAGPVRVGDPLTLVIYMRSEIDGFDIVVSDCFAHNGGNKRISLIDNYGCPVDEKLISHFEGSWTHDETYDTQVYAFMKTFRFTGSPALYIECDVRMCHGNCPSQPCHWRRSSSRQSRSVESKIGNMSESLNLFQALQVLREDQIPRQGKIGESGSDMLCLANGTFSAMAGLVAGIIGLLTALCSVLCIRLKKRKQSDDLSSAFSIKSSYIPPLRRRLE